MFKLSTLFIVWLFVNEQTLFDLYSLYHFIDQWTLFWTILIVLPFVNDQYLNFVQCIPFNGEQCLNPNQSIFFINDQCLTLYSFYISSMKMFELY